MNFIQPYVLAALPLVALPILIHLINHHRHRTIEWGAMMFLLNAKRMTRGMARIRQILILVARMLAVAAIVFAISRPLASGWLGVAAGGSPDTTIILLDRSASMEQQDLQEGRSKRETALAKVSELIRNLGSNTRVVLIENTDMIARDIDSPNDLLDVPATAATSTTADIPGMMQAALDYITNNQSGRTDIWICSDLRRNDWNPDGGRWAGTREALNELQGVRFYLLNYAEAPADNLAVTVKNVHRRKIGDSPELVMDIHIKRTGSSQNVVNVPLQIVINGARSELEIELTDQEYVRQGYALELDRETKTGWGRIELPNDSNPQDNMFHFVFSEPPTRRTAVVSDNKEASRLLKLAASTPVEPTLEYQVDVVSPARASEIEWDETGLLLWQANLPTGVIAKQLQNFVDSGRSVIFFPPDKPDNSSLFGVSWNGWEQAESNQTFRVSDWRGESDLLSHTQDGSSLPVGDLKTFRYCNIQSERGRTLAKLEAGGSLLTRADADKGAVYFCSTLPQQSHSNLAQSGLVFYIALQRALAQGSASLGTALQKPAANDSFGEKAWKPANDLTVKVLSSQRPINGGVFQDEERWLALNRPDAEDQTETIEDATIEELLSGLDYIQVDDRLGGNSSLASEIWRSFIYILVVALLLEAILCLPQKNTPQNDEVFTQRSNFASDQNVQGEAPREETASVSV